jgi:aspartyl-tRNA(Asn)/glutamyl-tRNA(Gln) amidotransferase subunit B
VDYNRAGTPLMEIVTDPALASADEAYALLTSLRVALVQGGISDCDMEKGQMRCDANISIRPVGETKLGTKVELKNLNSISFVRDGIAHEIRRQLAVKESGGTIVQETRDFDGQTGTSQSLRSKEMAHDYRYFPDPDLMPVKVDEAWKAFIRATVPEHHFDRQRRFMADYQLPYTITSVLVPDRALADTFEATAKLGAAPQAASNWIANDLLRELAAAKQTLGESQVQPAHIAGLVKLVDSGVISNSIAKEVFVTMFQTGDLPDVIVEKQGLKQSTDTGALGKWVAEAIAANPRAVAEFKTGNEKALNAIKGAVMKASAGKANPQLVDQLARKLIG